MIRLIYISRGARITESDLDAILAKSISNNEKNDVTGCLLLNEGLFLQYLEGPEKSVRETFNRIKGDPRHDEIEVLHMQRISERIFPQWGMTYQPLSGFNDYESDRVKILFGLIKDPNSSLEILEFLQSVRARRSLQSESDV